MTKEDPLYSFVAQIRLLLQTFCVARPSSIIISQCSDFLSLIPSSCCSIFSQFGPA